MARVLVRLRKTPASSLFITFLAVSSFLSRLFCDIDLIMTTFLVSADLMLIVVSFDGYVIVGSMLSITSRGTQIWERALYIMSSMENIIVGLVFFRE